MNNLIARKMILTSSYQPLSAGRLVATVTLTAHPDNTGSAYLLGDTGDSVPLSPGEWHTFKSVNLAAIQVKGTANDVMTMIGGTW
jgi:hypothetical protein